MSLQSMLTGNTKNERPEGTYRPSFAKYSTVTHTDLIHAGDQQFVANNRRRPRDIDFYYHDNTV
jgi:ubiquitin-conjugating enzyme E2 W